MYTSFIIAETIIGVMSMSIYNDQEIPVGLGMALAQNLDAMEVFNSMDDGSRQNVIERARHVKSKQEMESMVYELNSYR